MDLITSRGEGGDIVPPKQEVSQRVYHKSGDYLGHTFEKRMFYSSGPSSNHCGATDV
jgi:hypothetical protein